MRAVAGGSVLLVKAGRGGVSVPDWQRHETRFCFFCLWTLVSLRCVCITAERMHVFLLWNVIELRVPAASLYQNINSFYAQHIKAF